MKIPFYIVDAFTIGSRRFTGNPAAVCLLKNDAEITDELKQRIASEINLSETAFVGQSSMDSSQELISLRWFTPKNEVELCGHATLATAKVLFDQLRGTRSTLNPEDVPLTTQVQFESKYKGRLTAGINWTSNLISLDFPSNPSEPLDVNEFPWLEQIIRHTIGLKHSTQMVSNLEYSPGTKKLVIELDSQLPLSVLDQVSPNFDQLLQVKENDVVRGVIVTIRGKRATGQDNGDGGDEPDFYSRYFTPWYGINEDPVTGSAHTVLCPYWSSRLGKSLLWGRQSSARGGDVHCSLTDNRVVLSGKAVVVVSGELTYDD